MDDCCNHEGGFANLSHVFSCRLPPDGRGPVQLRPYSLVQARQINVASSHMSAKAVTCSCHILNTDLEVACPTFILSMIQHQQTNSLRLDLS